MKKHFQIEAHGYCCTTDMIYDILMKASAECSSLEATCADLEQVADSNTVREYMIPRRFRNISIRTGMVILVASILACSASQKAAPPSSVASATVPPEANTATAVPTTIVHTILPGELPAASVSQVSDWNSSTVANQHRTAGGDNIAANAYERPFNANAMDTYFPNLDILKGGVFSAAPWVYVSITMAGQAASGGLPDNYSVELDLNLDGRGDVLVMASKPGASWSTEVVRAWKDTNQDVGGSHPISADAPVSGDGYETLVFDQGAGSDPDLAWARISATEPNTVQLAFKQSLIDNDPTYAWGLWAMSPNTFNPAWFDFNDHFTAEQMCSPLAELKSYYPIKAFAEVDNTCRAAVGFTPTSSIPGLCALPITPTPVLPGTISGRVFNDDANRDGTFDSTSYPYQNIPVEIHEGTCSGTLAGTASSNSQGFYSINVPPGTYCVIINQRTDPNGAPPQTVKVPNGGTVNVDFAFWG